MKRQTLLKVFFAILFSFILNSIFAHPASKRISNEISGALELWNAAAKSAQVDRCLSMFDNSEEIILVG